MVTGSKMRAARCAGRRRPRARCRVVQDGPGVQENARHGTTGMPACARSRTARRRRGRPHVRTGTARLQDQEVADRVEHAEGLRHRRSDRRPAHRCCDCVRSAQAAGIPPHARWRTSRMTMFARAASLRRYDRCEAGMCAVREDHRRPGAVPAPGPGAWCYGVSRVRVARSSAASIRRSASALALS